MYLNYFIYQTKDQIDILFSMKLITVMKDFAKQRQSQSVLKELTIKI
jgi:hypothetical protein